MELDVRELSSDAILHAFSLSLSERNFNLLPLKVFLLIGAYRLWRQDVAGDRCDEMWEDGWLFEYLF